MKNTILNICKHYVQEYGFQISITAFTIIAFMPTFFNGFQMEWDDQWMVLNSQTLSNLNKDLMYSIFMVPSHGQIAPINQIMYTLLYRCFGLSPLAFHTASLIFHLFNIYLLYYGLSIILHDCTQIPARRARWIVFITTILFAIHPLQVESVAWISASKILISTTFYFAGTIALIKYLRNGSRWWYACSLIMQLMAYLSKEQTVIFPIFAALIFLWYGIRPNSRRFWFGLLPFCLLCMVCAAHEVFYIANYDQYIQGETYEWWQRIIFSVYSIITYFFKWLVPINLNWMYLFPIGMGEKLPLWLILYPVLSASLVYVFWHWLKNPIILSFLAFFFIHLLLVIHIIVLPRTSIVADRYLYISIIGLNFAFAYFVTGIEQFINRTKLMMLTLSIIVTVLVVTSYSRTMVWKDSNTLKNVINTESRYVLT